MTLPERLQGTDGIRGRVAPDDDLKGKSSLSHFLEQGFLTPSFFELYAYSYGRMLLKNPVTPRTGPVVVGWDSRDKTNVFNQAAVRGLLKSGLDVSGVGVLPTPAIPLYMLKTESRGAIVLTASHNPSDQNGIKCFHGATALKFLPVDDVALTREIFENADINLNEIKEVGQFTDHSATAREFFIGYHQDPKNSWIGNEPFDDMILVIDASNGAVATVVREIFSRYSFNGLFFTNMSGEINEYCGVADIEGEEEIQRDDVVHETSRFARYQALQTVYNIARDNHDVESGKVKLTTLVFDGDGDRCFRLDYNPETKGLIVSSGDFLGIHQARYLLNQMSISENRPRFVNTVESDLNTGITAEDLGYEAVLTGVGDKWILLNAITDHLYAYLDDSYAADRDLREILDATGEKSEWSGAMISGLWNEIQNRQQDLPRPSAFNFQLGIEESGHCITAGFYDKDHSRGRSFAGNGIKAGLNSLVACREVFRQSSQTDWYEFIARPYTIGLKETFYVYYVNKDNLLPGTSYRAELETVIKTAIDSAIPEGYEAKSRFFPEEDSMVFFLIKKGVKTCGAVFVRNSGTEDKSALYLRGEPNTKEFLAKIGQKVHLHLLKTLKKERSEFVQFEKKALETVAKSGDLDSLMNEYSGTLPVSRVLKEIEFKQRLITREQGVPRLTDTGKSFIGYEV